MPTCGWERVFPPKLCISHKAISRYARDSTSLRTHTHDNVTSHVVSVCRETRTILRILSP